MIADVVVGQLARVALRAPSARARRARESPRPGSMSSARTAKASTVSTAPAIVVISHVRPSLGLTSNRPSCGPNTAVEARLRGGERRDIARYPTHRAATVNTAAQMEAASRAMSKGFAPARSANSASTSEPHMPRRSEVDDQLRDRQTPAHDRARVAAARAARPRRRWRAPTRSRPSGGHDEDRGAGDPQRSGVHSIQPRRVGLRVSPGRSGRRQQEGMPPIAASPPERRERLT